MKWPLSSVVSFAHSYSSSRKQISASTRSWIEEDEAAVGEDDRDKDSISSNPSSSSSSSRDRKTTPDDHYPSYSFYSPAIIRINPLFVKGTNNKDRSDESWINSDSDAVAAAAAAAAAATSALRRDENSFIHLKRNMNLIQSILGVSVRFAHYGNLGEKSNTAEVEKVAPREAAVGSPYSRVWFQRRLAVISAEDVLYDDVGGGGSRRRKKTAMLMCWKCRKKRERRRRQPTKVPLWAGGRQWNDGDRILLDVLAGRVTPSTSKNMLFGKLSGKTVDKCLDTVAVAAAVKATSKGLLVSERNQHTNNYKKTIVEESLNDSSVNKARLVLRFPYLKSDYECGEAASSSSKTSATGSTSGFSDLTHSPMIFFRSTVSALPLSSSSSKVGNTKNMWSESVRSTGAEDGVLKLFYSDWDKTAAVAADEIAVNYHGYDTDNTCMLAGVDKTAEFQKTLPCNTRTLQYQQQQRTVHAHSLPYSYYSSSISLSRCSSLSSSFISTEDTIRKSGDGVVCTRCGSSLLSSYPGNRCPDFTLDAQKAEKISKKIKESKKERCWCHLITSFFGFAFLLLCVMLFSMVLTRGERTFGSL